MSHKSAVSWIFALVFCAQAPLVGAETRSTDPMTLLERMSRAGTQTEYQGVFTYEHGSSAESFRISHRLENGQRYERLEYLNGPEYTLERSNGKTACRPPGAELLQGQALDTDQLGRLEQYYHLNLKGSDRVAGRVVDLIEVRPKDQLRYGYLLGLDRATGLLLKALLIDEQQRLLERFQFVSLDLDKLELQAQTSSVSTDEKRPDRVACTRTLEQPNQWQLAWLPPGFTFAGEQQRPKGIEMLTYTDGLASFSVFLQPISGPGQLEGRAQRGATSAYMGQISLETTAANAGNQRSGAEAQPLEADSYRVTVVGEIPAAVAERVVDGIGRRMSESASEDAS